MRLHHLEATAFGPFADTVSVDFDALSAAGLFLLTGATGAGKTSVLDAVCFALYGDVPGDRAAAKRLRSDQASAGVAPRVVLDCTLAGRRFRLTRSPAWERPKKRGTGTTGQQASVVVAERVDGEWSTLSTRLDEAGYLVSSLVGMTLTQFTQVVMLPQGRFQAFLRARSEQRHALLQRLFNTGRFEDVEKWLREHRQALSARARQHHEDLADLVSRLSEVAVQPPPLTGGDLHASSDELVAWAVARRGAARREATRAESSRARTAEHEQLARARLADAEALAERQRRHHAATAERERLLADRPDQEALRCRIDRARRAASIPPLQRADHAAREAHADAAVRSDRAEQVARAWLVDGGAEGAGPGTVAAWQAAQADASAAAAGAAALSPVAERIAMLDDLVASSSMLLADVGARTAAADERVHALPRQLEVLRGRLAEAERAAGLVTALGSDVERAEARLIAAEQVVALEDERTATTAAAQAAIDELHRRKEAWLELQQARVAGMAAELAGRIAVGDDCPVCGSTEHPSLATPAPDAPDAAAEKAARRLVDDAEATRHAHEGAVQAVSTRLEVAREVAGGIAVTAARAQVERTRQESTDTAALATAVAPRRSLLREAEANLTAAQTAREEGRAEAARLAAQREAAAAEAAHHRERIDRQLSGSGCATLGDLVQRLEATAAACGAVVTARREEAYAEESMRAAALRTGRAASDAGFDDVESALEAAWAAEAIAEAEVALRRHDVSLAAAERTLADPDLAAAAAEPTPDPPALRAVAATVAEALRRHEREAAVTRERAVRLHELTKELQTATAAFSPLRRELEVATSLSAFVDGRSPDNRLQMRLSAYVVAHRLSQVVAAANERLARMSDRRYTLEHTGRRGAGETRGGLSLVVRDDWSGESRDPATLSGGESFVVALALALGLSDVITQEAGGADLDTLFVDEGFGALDAETLDDVLDTLDSLRDGGRVVGVVSHVPEMRDRIPTRLAVLKHRDGSTVRLERAGDDASIPVRS